MATDKRVFTLRMSERNFEKIKAIAKKERRSMAVTIEIVLENFITEYEGEHGDIVISEDSTK